MVSADHELVHSEAFVMDLKGKSKEVFCDLRERRGICVRENGSLRPFV